MKTGKKHHSLKLIFILFLSIISFVFPSCEHQVKDKGFSEQVLNISENNINSKGLGDGSSSGNTTFYPVKDLNGSLIGGYIYPANWLLGDLYSTSATTQNSKEVKIFNALSKVFIDFNDKKENTIYKKMGIAIAPVKSLQEIIKEDIISIADLTNNKIIKQYPIPELALSDKSYDNLFFSTDRPEEVTYKAVGTEWVNNQEGISLVVIRYQSLKYSDKIVWGYTIDKMNSSEENFQKAKDIFLNSLKNFQICYRYIYMYNMKQIRRIIHNNTAQYFTPAQKMAQKKEIYGEQKRTGTFEFNSYDKYLKFLKSKGIVTNNNSSTICNDHYLKENTASINDYIINESEIYTPNTDNDTIGRQ